MAIINWEALAQIDGWLADDARVVTTDLIAWQRSEQLITGVLEFGVFRGKYLALASALVADLDVPCVGIDAFLARHGVLLEDADRAHAQAAIVTAVESVIGAPATNLTLIAAYTHDVSVDELRAVCPNGYSFISVDAGHDAHEVEHDSRMADVLLSADGAVAFDDVYNHLCPGVAAGFMRYMESSDRDLAPFATGGNKVWCCRPERHADYLALARQIMTSHPRFINSLEHAQENLGNGWTPTLFGYEVATFAWGV